MVLRLVHRPAGTDLGARRLDIERDDPGGLPFLRRAGADAVLARVGRADWEDLVLSPDRRFAVAHLRDEHGERTVLFAADAADDAPRELVPKIARGFVWLPAARRER